MISIIVYGRNDDHGYNLHRRVALSLNCLAEVLTDDDDEIVFVDYNTPDQLPTLVEALADTLTVRCLSALRVIRVRERTHVRLFAGRTHLPIVEPVARNVGARHANPANRWLLSTNTDMILVPLEDESLSEICDRLPDGFYALPRFELPEWLWEQLPRTDPSRVLADVGHLGPTLQLGETVTSHEEIRFDAPGDFQLVLREEFFAIDGFDEEMVLGWHVDSNLSKRCCCVAVRSRASRTTSPDTMRRCFSAGTSTRTSVDGCSHTAGRSKACTKRSPVPLQPQRTLTVYHDTGLANDLGRFFQGGRGGRPTPAARDMGARGTRSSRSSPTAMAGSPAAILEAARTATQPSARSTPWARSSRSSTTRGTCFRS